MSMRKRQEVQKVSRRHSLVCLALLAERELIRRQRYLPDQFGEYKRVAKGQVQISDRPVWDEYGFQNRRTRRFTRARRSQGQRERLADERHDRSAWRRCSGCSRVSSSMATTCFAWRDKLAAADLAQLEGKAAQSGPRGESVAAGILTRQRSV